MAEAFNVPVVSHLIPVNLPRRNCKQPQFVVESRYAFYAGDTPGWNTCGTAGAVSLMSNPRLLSCVLPFLILAISVVPCPLPRAEEHTPAPAIVTPSETTPLPPYIQRGNEVTARYHAYTARLGRFHGALHALLARNAPDLAAQLREAPPQPVASGYQILPHLVADAPLPEPSPRPISTAYSWGRTEQLLAGEHVELTVLETSLQEILRHPAVARRPTYAELVAEYQQLEINQQRIDDHIQYNHFWQQAIAADRARFDHLTRLHDAVLLRQAIRDTLQTTFLPDAAALRAQEQELSAYISAQNAQVRPAPFLTVHHPHPRHWIVQVPLYTDIQDPQFLLTCKQAIETTWQVRDGDTEYRVQVVLRPVHPQHLYWPDPSPHPGAHIDVGAHVARFPPDGGVLTTGANSTYAMAGRYVALGPQDISFTTLAHEFGHILGFPDGYFRGYRDLEDWGYEVLEIVPDPTDLMSAPGRGRALRRHFETLIAAPPPTSRAGFSLEVD